MSQFTAAQMKMFNERGTRPLQIGKFGLEEDPRDLDVTWTVGSRTYLARVEGSVRDERGYTILKSRHFNGEQAPDIGAGNVQVLIRTFSED